MKQKWNFYLHEWQVYITAWVLCERCLGMHQDSQPLLPGWNGFLYIMQMTVVSICFFLKKIQYTVIYSKQLYTQWIIEVTCLSNRLSIMTISISQYIYTVVKLSSEFMRFLQRKLCRIMEYVQHKWTPFAAINVYFTDCNNSLYAVKLTITQKHKCTTHTWYWTLIWPHVMYHGCFTVCPERKCLWISWKNFISILKQIRYNQINVRICYMIQ
jgi:hypothetical protein